MVTPAELQELIADCPHLYHMAMRGSFPLIQKLGLIPTDILLERFEVPREERVALTQVRRPAAVAVTHAELGCAHVRDQLPLLDTDLEVCLRDGLTSRDWHKRLNERVFFWLTRKRLQTMLGAGAYKNQEHIVLKVCTASLVARHHGSIELSPMNSGATRPWRHPRGRDTFLPIAQYPYEQWRKARSRGERVVELTVIGGVPDIMDHVEEVRVEAKGHIGQVLYSR